MKVLIPLLSKYELNEDFLDKAVKGSSEVILLMVIDAEKGSSLKASDISSSTHFMEEVKKAIGKKRKSCEEFTEWGEPAKKIKNTAIINKADKIALLKQENQWFEKILEELKKEKEIKNRLHVIEVDFQKPEIEDLKDWEENKEKTKKENKETEEEKKLVQKKDLINETKKIADKLLKTGFKGIDSIKKIRFKKNKED